VDKTHRNQCRSCRLTRCLEAGMNKEGIYLYLIEGVDRVTQEKKKFFTYSTRHYFIEYLSTSKCVSSSNEKTYLKQK
jgi:hypothetical protein